MTPKKQEPPPQDLDLLGQNVQALAELHAKGEQETEPLQLRIESMTAKLGRPRTLYVLLALFGLWIGGNLLAPVFSLPRLDPPPFPWMQGFVGLMALFTTVMILITQQRQGKMAARRALLDLHANLLAEQKVAKLIGLLEELRRDLPSVANRHDPQAEAMAKPIDPQAAIDRLEAEIAQATTGLPVPAARAAMGTKMEKEVAEVIREAELTEPADDKG